VMTGRSSARTKAPSIMGDSPTTHGHRKGYTKPDDLLNLAFPPAGLKEEVQS
jgi:hypothetical protein